MVVCRMLCMMLCVLVAGSAIADPVMVTMDGPQPPSVVRLPGCGTVEAEGQDECRCPAGTVTCLDRDESEQVVVNRSALDQCMIDLAGCRAEAVQPVAHGWDPWVVVGVTVAITITVGAMAFGGGYLVAR